MEQYLVADKQKGYWLKQILPHVYHLHFDSAYLLAMHFLRAQEYYESPKFADKLFTILEFMEWYATEYGHGVFDYVQTWSGFNVPSWVLDSVYTPLRPLPDPNKYDRKMWQVIEKIQAQERKLGPHLGSNYYLIGTSSAGYKNDNDEESVLDHEIAHALYYTNVGYKKDVDLLLKNLNGGRYIGEKDPFGLWPSPYNEAFKVLAKEGYHSRTITDEIHAYASTGAHVFGLEKILTDTLCRPFEENFKKWKQKLMGNRG